jgi:hypothetical protein
MSVALVVIGLELSELYTCCPTQKAMRQPSLCRLCKAQASDPIGRRRTRPVHLSSQMRLIVQQVSYLGRDVLWSATGSLAQAVSVLILGQAKVAQLQQGGMWVEGMGCQQQVLQLDIPVDYAHGMTEGQGCNQLLEQPPARHRPNNTLHHIFLCRGGHMHRMNSQPATPPNTYTRWESS